MEVGPYARSGSDQTKVSFVSGYSEASVEGFVTADGEVLLAYGEVWRMMSETSVVRGDEDNGGRVNLRH